MSATATSTEGRAARSGGRAPVVRSLRLDALMSGSAGLVLAAGAPVLDGTLGAPIAFLIPVGVFLLGYALWLEALARAGAPAPGVKTVIAGNAVWVAVSVAAVAADWLTLTTAGNVLALVQAAAVALVAELQLTTLRRAR